MTYQHVPRERNVCATGCFEGEAADNGQNRRGQSGRDGQRYCVRAFRWSRARAIHFHQKTESGQENQDNRNGERTYFTLCKAQLGFTHII